LSVAQKLQDKFTESGFSVGWFPLKVVNSAKSGGEASFENIPDLSGFDALVFASWVEAFSLCTDMRSFLRQIPNLGKKKVALFVTQHFPFAWMGGNHAIRQMKAQCEKKGAIVVEAGVVNWSSSRREGMIFSLVERLAKSFR